jgi:hypothetical protein
MIGCLVSKCIIPIVALSQEIHSNWLY